MDSTGGTVVGSKARPIGSTPAGPARFGRVCVEGFGRVAAPEARRPPVVRGSVEFARTRARTQPQELLSSSPRPPAPGTM